jgi:hypothetical protein
MHFCGGMKYALHIMLTGLAWLACSGLIGVAQASPPESWPTDPRLINVSQLPKVQNLDALYSGLSVSDKGSGAAAFQVLVDENGRVTAHQLIEQRGVLTAAQVEPLLAALSYAPALRGGVKVASRTTVAIVWPKPTGEASEPPVDEVVSYEQPAKPLNLGEITAKIGYPAEAKAAGQHGRLVINVLVDEYGRYSTHVLKRTAGRLLLQAVEADIAALTFVPAFDKRGPAKAWVEVAFDFPAGK